MTLTAPLLHVQTSMLDIHYEAHGPADDGVGPPPEEDDDLEHFSGFYRRQVLPGVGHNIPQEAPQATVAAIIELLDRA